MAGRIIRAQYMNNEPPPPAARETPTRANANSSGRSRVLAVPAEALAASAALPRREREAILLQALARVAANLAHTLNGGVSVVCGNIALMPSAATDDEKNQMLEDMARAMERLDLLARNLGALSSFASLHLQEIDIAAFLERKLDLFAALVGDDYTLSLITEASEPTVIADPEYLALALNALVINAAEAMPRRGTIRLACRDALAVPQCAGGRDDKRGASERYVALCVSDSGRGMSEEAAARAFEAGYTSKRTAGNAGLGLWFARMFAAACDGALWICDNGPTGVSVALALPVATRSERALEDTAAGDTPATADDGERPAAGGEFKRR